MYLPSHLSLDNTLKYYLIPSQKNKECKELVPGQFPYSLEMMGGFDDVFVWAAANGTEVGMWGVQWGAAVGRGEGGCGFQLQD